MDHKYFFEKKFVWTLRAIVLAALITFILAFNNIINLHLIVMMGLFVIMLLRAHVIFGAHVVVGAERIKGLRIRSRLMTFGMFDNNPVSKGELHYYDIGSVREGKILGLPYWKYTNRRKPYESIIVFYTKIKEADDCFQCIDDGIRSVQEKLSKIDALEKTLLRP